MQWGCAEGGTCAILINLQNSLILISCVSVYSCNIFLLICYVVPIHALGIQQWTGQTRSLPSWSSCARGETGNKQDTQKHVYSCDVCCWWCFSWGLKDKDLETTWGSGDENGDCREYKQDAHLKCSRTETGSVRLSIERRRAVCRGEWRGRCNLQNLVMGTECKKGTRKDSWGFV